MKRKMKIEFCCEGMKGAYQSADIKYNDAFDGEFYMPCEGRNYTRWLTYCPFCGVKLEIINEYVDKFE